MPIFASEVVLYAPLAGEGTDGETNQIIRSLRMTTSLDGETQGVASVEADLASEGTRVELDRAEPFDHLQIVIQESDVEGLYEDARGPALAEIEVIARAAGTGVPVRFRRGDCNADGEVNISDATCTLARLFAGTAAPGCLAALNTNGDDDINITDPVFLLNFLFAGGPRLSAPFPDCGPATLPADRELGCANSPDCQ